MHRGGNEPDPVANQDEQQQCHADRDEASSPRPHRRLGEISHLTDQELPENLELARHTAGDFRSHAKSQEEKDSHREQC